MVLLPSIIKQDGHRIDSKAERHYASLDEDELQDYRPVIVLVDERNRIVASRTAPPEPQIV
jgi:aspartate 1-decarboxylase